MNISVVKGEIENGASSRGNKMLFLRGLGYLYISTTKHTIGWRCVRRDVKCMVVIHTLKEKGDFSH